MKKFVSLLLIVFCLLSTNVYAEQKVGAYHVFDKVLDVEAGFGNKGELNVYIEVTGEYDHRDVMLRIRGEENVKSFTSALQQVRDKFNEWKGVANANGVTDYKKAIDVTFPDVEIYWWGSSKWYSTYSRNFIKMIFLVSDDGSASVGCGGEAKDWDNEYITEKWYFLFGAADEIDGLIKVLDVEKIKNKLSSKQNTDDLFN